MQTSAAYFGRRRGPARITINRGMSRLPREKTGGSGLGKVRKVPQSVGGRRAHPPQNKDYSKKINKGEYLLAFSSAIAATANKDLVGERGHDIESVPEIPIIVEDSIQKMNKTKDVIACLKKFGLEKELERCGERKIRAGKGTRRGRKYKNKKGVLLVVADDEGVGKAASNIPGMDVVRVEELDVELLAPGTHAGRLTIWTKKALDTLT